MSHRNGAQPGSDDGAKQPSLVGEFLQFVGQNKKWWLIPIVVVVAVLTLLAFVSGTAPKDLMYTLF